MKIIRLIVITFLSLYTVGGMSLYLLQRNLMYFPSEKINHSLPVEHFSVENEKIKVLVINKGMAKAVIYFGGNAETVARNARSYTDLFPDYTIYLVNYRGYGGSTGSPTEAALYADAKAIYDSIQDRHQQISIIGRSLGTGVATYLASVRAVDRMILVTPYDSIEEVAYGRYPIYPILFLLTDKYDSAARVRDISAKTLIILAEHDVVIPLENSRRLDQSFSGTAIDGENDSRHRT